MKSILMIYLMLAIIYSCTTNDKEVLYQPKIFKEGCQLDIMKAPTKQDSTILHFENCMRISRKAQREMDSINNNIK